MGVYTTHTDAEAAINALKAFGVAESEISYVYKDPNGNMADKQTGEKVTSGATMGATAGAVVGGIAGLVVANGILPGLGSLFVAGPLTAMLGLGGAAATTAAGAVTGAAAGGLIGALTQLGVSNDDAVLFQNHVEKGGVLLIARTDKVGTREIFDRTNATQVQEYSV